MRFGTIGLTCLLTASLLSGCATVNMSEIAVPQTAKAEAPAEKNIVLRAATKLYNALTNRGFVAKDSGERVQSAANILLEGLKERDVTVDSVDYAAQNYPKATVEADIRYAARQVSQTTKAAEVYLEIADTDQNMREELQSLEKALLAARDASTVFSQSIDAENSELLYLDSELDGLTRITDRFGERVRLQAAAELAARRADEKS